MDNAFGINVEDIMAEIRKKIKDENLSSTALSFDDVPLNAPEVLIRGGYDTDILMNSTVYISANNQLVSNTPLGGDPIKRFIKKLIRKLVQFYVVPIVDQQNAFNRSCSDAFLQINGFVHKSAENDVGVMSMRIEELELRQLYNKREIEELTEQVRRLKKEIEALNSSTGSGGNK